MATAAGKFRAITDWLLGTEKSIGGKATFVPAVNIVDSSNTIIDSFSGGGGTSGATATAASPTLTEGATNQPLSVDLHDALRVLMQAPDGTSIDPTAAAKIVNYDGSPGIKLAAGSLSTVFASDASLPAGTNIIGSVRIDPTTQGTTNGVVARGQIAVGSADSGDPNPVKMGAVYRASLTSRADGSRTEFITNDYGTLRVGLAGQTNEGAGLDARGNTTSALTFNTSNSTGPFQIASYAFNGATWDRQRGDTNANAMQPALTANFWSYAAGAGGITNSTTAATVKTAAGASIRNYVEALELSWDSLGTATEVAIRDGAAGTVLYRTKLPNGSAGRETVKFGTALKGTANTLLEVVTLTATGTGSVFANLQGWTGV